MPEGDQFLDKQQLLQLNLGKTKWCWSGRGNALKNRPRHCLRFPLKATALTGHSIFQFPKKRTLPGVGGDRRGGGSGSWSGGTVGGAAG